MHLGGIILLHDYSHTKDVDQVKKCRRRGEKQAVQESRETLFSRTRLCRKVEEDGAEPRRNAQANLLISCM